MRRFIRSEASRRFPAGVVPGLVAVGLLIVWAVHEGGFFPDTWYWGALATLALLTVTVLSLGLRLGTIPPTVRAALVFLGLYVMWSYLSITWAQYPGAALEGSNRTLLYWLVFALFAVVPWTVEAALAAMAAFVLAVGTVAVVIMIRLATGDHIVGLFIFGRLATPTGYYNASAALFTMSAVVAVALAARRELPVPLRAVLLAIACAGLQLALIGQSRGWLFTLPLVALAAVAVLSDRLRLVVAATAPIVATLVAVHRLLDVYRVSANGKLVGRAFRDAAMRAGRTSLVLCAAVLLVGALMALADGRLPPLTLSGARRRALGLAVAAVVVVGGSVGATVATHGRPFHFVAREWDGFSHVPTGPAPSSNFTQVGSGRYDFWRVALDAVLAHPIGGLGQDNFADYYMRRRRTAEQPEWTHSLEMRLLAHTGFVGFGLFSIFLIAALAAALAARRRAGHLFILNAVPACRPGRPRRPRYRRAAGSRAGRAGLGQRGVRYRRWLPDCHGHRRRAGWPGGPGHAGRAGLRPQRYPPRPVPARPRRREPGHGTDLGTGTAAAHSHGERPAGAGSRCPGD